MTILSSAAVLIFILSLIEGAVRLFGLADYILYARSDQFGFSPKPNAAGRMRGRYHWRINSRGERSDSEAGIEPDSIVLVGDSIVEGGSFVDQSQTLGERIIESIGRRVHPVAAGGWTLSNELLFIAANDRLLDAGTFIFVSNSNDLELINDRPSPVTHPTNRPRLHSLFLLCRYSSAMWHRFLAQSQSASPEPIDDSAWQIPLAAFLQRFGGRLIWVLYPSRSELRNRIAPCAKLREQITGHAEIIDLSAAPNWTHACYLDELHPSAEGRRVLASTLTLAILSKGQDGAVGTGG